MQSNWMVQIHDQNTDDGAVIIIRTVGSTVGLALSLQHGADVDVYMTQSECSQVVAALQEAANSLMAVGTPGTLDRRQT